MVSKSRGNFAITQSMDQSDYDRMMKRKRNKRKPKRSNSKLNKRIRQLNQGS